jgi:AcrR family transcriptional regulator
MTKHKSSDERTTQILEAARTCFIEKGYFATKMDEIAGQAGLSKGGVYFHFESKQDIFHTLVEREYERTKTFLESVAVEEGDFATKIMHIAGHFTSIFESSDNPRFVVVIMEMSLRDDDIAQLFTQMQQSYLDKMAEMITWGIAQGELREVDAEATSFLLKSLLDGIQLAYTHAHTIASPERIVTSGLDMVLKGLLK